MVIPSLRTDCDGRKMEVHLRWLFKRGEWEGENFPYARIRHLGRVGRGLIFSRARYLITCSIQSLRIKNTLRVTIVFSILI